jgi:hypothetical protein
MKTPQSIEDLKAIHKEFLALDKLHTTHKILFFKPLGNQHAFFESIARVRLAFGSNRSGKSVIGVCELIACGMGYRPWLKENDPHYWVRLGTGEKIPVPNVGFHLVESLNTSGKMILLEKLKEWLPKDWGKVKLNNLGQPVAINFANGSICHIYSQNMNIDALEGPSGHYLSCDEPPTQAFWNAIKRGLVDHDGIAWISATPLKSSYFMAELMDKANADLTGEDYHLTSLSIQDNRKSAGGYLPDKAVDSFIESLPADEIEARVYGRPKHLAGAVYKEFMNRPPYCVDPFDIPEDWPRIMAVDPAERKPMAAVWIAIAPDNKWYIYRDVYEANLRTTHQFCNWVKEAEGWLQRGDGTWYSGRDSERVAMRLIDTSANKLERSSGYTIAQALRQEDIYVVNANKSDFIGGINRVREMLDFDPQYEWSQGPQLVVFNNCRRVIHEFQNYVWTPGSAQSKKTGSDPLDKPVATNDDCLDCVRYLAVTQMTYAGLRNLQNQLGI